MHIEKKKQYEFVFLCKSEIWPKANKTIEYKALDACSRAGLKELNPPKKYWNLPFE